MALGYFNPNALGGYYQPGEKRDKKDVKYGAAHIAGVDIPAWALEAPIIQVAQMGATIRRVADEKFSHKDPTQKGLGLGIRAAALGALNSTPLMETIGDVGELRGNDRSVNKFTGGLLRDTFIPQGVQYVAKKMDTDANGEPIQRNPQTVGQYVGMGAPGLRSQVPLKAAKPPSYKPPTRKLFGTPH
jgi:hypothetical protein